MGNVKNNVLAILLVAMIILILAPGCLAKNYDFRQVNWWMTRDEVKASEDGELFLLEDEEMVAYAVNIINMDTFLVYYFDDKDLVWGSTILFRDEYENKDLYLRDFYYVRGVLTEKYGEPLLDDVRWVDGKEGEESALEVMKGNLRYSVFWVTDNTVINLILEGQEQQILLSIDYVELEYYLDRLTGPEDMIEPVTDSEGL